jgi:hypothetical protein
MSNQIYNSIYEVLEILRKDIPNNPLGTDYSKEEYEWIDCGDSDGGRIMPSMNSSAVFHKLCKFKKIAWVMTQAIFY